MESLRRRTPFKQEDEGNDNRIFDEQEQEAVVEALRSHNASSNAQYRVLLQGLLAISALLQLVYLLSPSKDSPLFAIFPASGRLSPPIPISACFTLVSLLLHGGLVLLCRQQTHVLDNIGLPNGIRFVAIYLASALAPSLSLLLSKPWQTTTWWCITPAMAFVTQTVLDSIDAGDHSVAELEGMMYRAPGA